MRRVFILGARASKYATRDLDIPIPLAREFFKSEYVNNLWPNNHLKKYSFANSSLSQFIHGFFNAKSKKNFSPKRYLLNINSSINIEEVYSFLQVLAQGNYYFHDEILLINKAKRELIEFLFYVLEDYHNKPYDKQLYSKITNSLTDDDTIITYNWDCLIDSALSTSVIGRELLKNTNNLINPRINNDEGDYDNVAFKNFHQPYFLKLHGSINWYSCNDKSCVRHNIPVVFDITGKLTCYWHCDYCGSLLDLMILPPHAHKSYKTNRFFSLQAKVASDKLKVADELIIIGYSFPDFDLEANALFRRACVEYVDLEWFRKEKRIVIVNPDISSAYYLEKIHNLFLINKTKRKPENLQLYKSIDEFLKKYK